MHITRLKVVTFDTHEHQVHNQRTPVLSHSTPTPQSMRTAMWLDH